MKTIELPHKVLDYACPINGIEDQYEWKTGTQLPGYVLMDLSSLGFTYIKQKAAPVPRMIFWGIGMGKPQYQFLSDVIGFDWSMSEERSFKTTWKSVLEFLEQGTPVSLGILDMYHLPYFEKFYHRYHIPQHFVLLVGYDEEKNVALVQDNSLPGVQKVPLSDLQQAWNVRVPGQGKPNTYFTLKFHERVANLSDILHKGLKKRAELFFNPPVGFMGHRGMKKAQAEISNWRKELTHKQWEESLRSLATFTCSVVPNPPQALLFYPLGYTDRHQSCRDRFASELAEYAKVFNEERWLESAECWRQSGEQIGLLTDIIVEALTDNPAAFDGASDLFGKIADLEEQACKLLL